MEAMKRATRRIGTTSNALEEQNKFFWGMRGDKITKEEATLLNHVKAFAEQQEDVVVPNQLLDLLFCLPCDIKQEVRSINTVRTIQWLHAALVSLTNPTGVFKASQLQIGPNTTLRSQQPPETEGAVG